MRNDVNSTNKRGQSRALNSNNNRRFKKNYTNGGDVNSAFNSATLGHGVFKDILGQLEYDDLLNINEACPSWSRAVWKLPASYRSKFSTSPMGLVWVEGTLKVKKEVDLGMVLGNTTSKFNIESIRKSGDKYFAGINGHDNIFVFNEDCTKWCEM